MSGNIWKSYLCTAVKKWDISDPRSCEHNWTSSWKETWKKFRSVRDLNPLPLRYRSSALRTELTSLLGADLYVGHIWKSYMKIIYVAHTWLSYISSYYSPLGRFIWIQQKKRQKLIPELKYWQTFGPFKIKMQDNQKPRFNNRGYRCFVLLLCFALFCFVFFLEKVIVK